MLVVHATDWNRLDVSAAATGRLLTARGPTAYSSKTRPEHYLDYFHGALHPSPDGRWLADDGWVWAPVGLPVVWDLRRWLAENVWESEDGPSWRPLAQRGYSWDVPVCWVGDGQVAVWGIGVDDEAMVSGVTVYDAETGVPVVEFAGPAGNLFSDGRRLYSAGPDGVTIWDPATGARTGAVPGFRPTAYHRGRGELAGVDDGHLVRWRLPGG